jgi:hypothetical protein
MLYLLFFIILVSRDSSVVIATCHEVDGPGIESRIRFSPTVQTVLGAESASRKMGAGVITAGKAAGAWR